MSDSRRRHVAGMPVRRQRAEGGGIVKYLELRTGSHGLTIA